MALLYQRRSYHIVAGSALILHGHTRIRIIIFFQIFCFGFFFFYLHCKTTVTFFNRKAAPPTETVSSVDD